MNKRLISIVFSLFVSLYLLGATVGAAETAASEPYEISADSEYVYALPDGKSVNALYESIEGVIFVRKSQNGAAAKTSEIAATGYCLLYSDGTERVLSVKGDIDGNGKVDASDKDAIASHIKNDKVLSKMKYKSADIDGNARITSTDFQMVRQHIINGKLISKQIGDIEPIDEDWVNRGLVSFADGKTEVTGNGLNVSGNTVTVTSGGEYAVIGKCGNGMIIVDCEEKVKLRLAGIELTNTKGPAVFFEKTKKSYITLESGTENKLADGVSYDVTAKGTVFSNSDLEIKGSGKLTVTANYRHAIACDDSLSIENGAVIITDAVKDAVHVNDAIDFIGGTLTVEKCGSDALDCDGTITVSGGTLNLNVPAGDAIKALLDISVTAGNINVLNADNGIKTDAAFSAKGGEFALNCFGNGIKAISSVVIEGGTFKISASREGIEGGTSTVANSSAPVLISSGVFDINAVGYAINATGKVALSGGEFDLHGGESKINAKVSVTTDGANIKG